MRCKSGHANIFRRVALTRVILKELSMLLSARVVVVALLFYVHGKHLRSCRDGQFT